MKKTKITDILQDRAWKHPVTHINGIMYLILKCFDYFKSHGDQERTSIFLVGKGESWGDRVGSWLVTETRDKD